MSDERRSVSISGSGSLGGGDYTRVSISGSGRVNGDLVAEELKISGSGKVLGRTETGQITISGSGSFADAVIVEEMRVSGSARVDGPVEVKELKCSGSFRAGGDVSGEYIKISGSLRVGGDVEADIFKASGGFEIGGLLSADKVEIHLGGRCSVQEIGGEKIYVERTSSLGGALINGLVKMFTGGGAAELRSAQIEADEVHLESTIADVVRGKRIEIGPGCKIGSVEYTESLKVHADATVERQQKV
jgi:cytoskeletal protein CcmA (bactofilin family)